MKDLNIVFVHYLTRADILEALTSLQEDMRASTYDVQITVVDNSKNQDGIKEFLQEQFREVAYLAPEENTGFARGNNLGFKQTPARYYFALNPDTRIFPASRTIDRIIEFMDAHPSIGCIGPKLIGDDGALQGACYRFDLKAIASKPLKQIQLDKKYARIRRHVDRLEMRDFDHNETRPVDWVLGAAMVVRREVVNEIGWFDPRYFMYMEDCDWCRTMWEHGWPVYFVHDIVIQHRHARESAKVPGIWRALYQNPLARIHLHSWLRYMWKWRGNHRYYGDIT